MLTGRSPSPAPASASAQTPPIRPDDALTPGKVALTDPSDNALANTSITAPALRHPPSPRAQTLGRVAGVWARRGAMSIIYQSVTRRKIGKDRHNLANFLLTKRPKLT